MSDPDVMTYILELVALDLTTALFEWAGQGETFSIGVPRERWIKSGRPGTMSVAMWPGKEFRSVTKIAVVSETPEPGYWSIRFEDDTKLWRVFHSGGRQIKGKTGWESRADARDHAATTAHQFHEEYKEPEA